VEALRAVLFDELRRDSSLVRSAATIEWASHLTSIASWDLKRIDEFVAHLESASAGNEVHVIADVREDHLEALGKLAVSDWEALAFAYCEWARAGFTFQFCDVIAGCLRKIYDDPHSGLSVKANVTTAMATLGARNTRWYCMQLLHPMTNTQIADALAQRIAMEIRANDLHADFEKCAREVHGWDREDFHQHILAALNERQHQLAP